MICRTYVHIQSPPFPLALAGNPTGGQEPKGSGTGKPRAGEDEPESTLDNDERIEATSHKGTEQNPESCNDHPPRHRQD
ncbi:hypothetical protein DY926_09245 [Komagataeibacter melaceti]|uniref:Uncharacterized protein n=1 Tax=Komagataeibacter melaceti TaxID=2766577 RepID=A0A371YZW9_9PROT|nr:hypothetical protein [Komagataeibacter melaceti]RFD19802.1 hypothetical protein DY926_09245 [Komagataeibacter melaceti]